MFKKLFLSVALLLAITCVEAQNLIEAEKLYQDGDFAAAQKQYEPLLQTATGDTLFQVQLRYAACQYSLGEYLNSAKTMLSFPLPSGDPWKARFLLYRIQMAQQASSIYRRILEEREIDDSSAKKNPELWTRAQWHKQIERDFESLWAMRDSLLAIPTETETLILNTKDTDLKRIPTLFDFVTQQYTQWLATQPEITLSTSQVPAYLNGQAQAASETKPFADKYASLLYAAYTLEGKNRQNARLFWQTDFILLPFEKAHWFQIPNEEKARQIALDKLYAISGFKTSGSLWNKLKSYATPLWATYGRAYAAYKAADILKNNDQRAQAVEVCEFAVKLGKNYFTDLCEQMRKEIKTPHFYFASTPQALVPETPALSARAYNLPTVYGRIYTTSFDELQKWAHKNGRHTLNRWEELLNLGQDQLKNLLKDKRSYQSFSQKITYKKPYTEQEISLNLPALTSGFYVLLVSQNDNFDPSESPVQGRIIPITHLGLFATAAIEDEPTQYVTTLQSASRTVSPSIFRFYAVNLQNGIPQEQTKLDVITDWKGSRTSLITKTQGKADLKGSLHVGYRTSNSLFADALAQKDGEYAFMSNPIYFHLYSQEPVRAYIQTDRAIYRPSQKVMLSANAFTRTANGWEVWPHIPLTLTVKDPNNQTVFSTTLTTNEMGTVQTTFTLPDGNTLLGSYDVLVKAKGADKRTFDFSHYNAFRVEEYKRPDYEISLNNLAAPLTYNQKGQVTGQAHYYTGAPLQGATVKYTVTRQDYVPPFYWWYFRPFSAPKQVAQGETQTDEKGNFQIAFTPQPQTKDEQFAQYRVQADVYDESGRPITTTRTYQISQKPLLFKASFSQGFFDAATPLNNFLSIDLTDVNGNSAQGTVSVRIAQLKRELPALPAEDNYAPRTARPSLEKWFDKIPEEKTVFSKDITFKKEGAQWLSAPALPEGVYRVTLSSASADTQTLVFVVAQDGKTLLLPAITLPQQTSYLVGETARILLGTSELKAEKQLEIYKDNSFLINQLPLEKGISVWEMKVEPSHRGGISLLWFGASNYRFHQGSTAVEIPFDNHELTAAWNIPDTVTPAQILTLRAAVTNNQKAPVNGQASLTVYDASLDYYAAKHNPFSAADFYPQTARTTEVNASFFTSGVYSYLEQKPTKDNFISPLAFPSLNLNVPLVSYRSFRKGATHMKMMAMPQAVMASGVKASFAGEANSDFALEEAAYSARSMDVEDALNPDESSPKDNASLRTDFAETAYFNSQIPLTNGQASVTFKMPDSLTKWNILGFVLTKDVSLGTYNLSTISRKDFMVRLVLPRFYREGDKGVLQAAVTNLTNKKITVPLTLSISQNGQNKEAAFGLKILPKTVTVLPQATAFTTWEITAPHTSGTYQLTAVGRLNKTTDGEQKEFLILPSKTRVLATTNKALQKGQNTLILTELQQDPSAKPEIASLRLHPTLALSVLNSMPNLLQNNYNDLVSSLNRYVPLSVVHQFYTTYPQLKEAVKKLPKRTTLTAPWNEKDPLRLTLLEQTPWLQLAQGNAVSQENIISLFNDSIVENRLKTEQKNIEKFQNANGSFSWFAGGPDDDYLTLYALNNFAQALSYKAPIPTQAAQKAFAYIVPKIETRLKQAKNPSIEDVSFALYAAYTLSIYPPQWAQMSQAKPYIQKWVDYADQHARLMTPLGQTYAASIYARLGDDIKANAYLDKVLARLKENELTGAYFAPEAQSWVWYNDTLSTQTTTLRTLLEIRPQSDKIASMLKWLLFNRQANPWNNAKASAQAVFTILDVMQAQGALSAPVTYQLKWADTAQKVSFEPFDWTEDLQFTKTGTQITPATYTANITKQGGSTDFASLSVVYTTANAKAYPKGVINLSREYFVRFTQGGTQKLRPVKDLSEVKIGDEVEVHLTLTTDSAFEYVMLDDPKPAGFENTDLTSAWAYQNISFYREVKDSTSRFFINWLPAGKVTLRYVLRPTVSGQMHILPAQVQSMYAPEYGAHTASEKVHVVK